MNKKWIEEFVHEHSEYTKLQGNELRARCPLPKHDDNKPSFAINLETHCWNCRGCGQAGKTVVSLVARVLNISVTDANQLVDTNSRATPFDTLQMVDNLRKGIVRYRHREPRKTIVELPPKASDQSPGIRYFLTQRAKQNKNVPYTKEQIRKIYKSFSCYYCDSGRYRGRIICPILDVDRTAVYQTNRSIDGNPIKTMFPSREECGNIGGHFLGEHLDQDSPIIVEGLFSALRLYSFGYQVISPLTCRLSVHQVRNIVSRYKKVTLCFDNDPETEKRKNRPGIEGMRKAYAILRDLVETEIIILPEGRDPDDLTRQEFDSMPREILNAREFKELKRKLSRT